VELDDKVTQLEDEVKILKNEIQAVLLDVRESYLNFENPVSRELPPFPEQHIVVSTPTPGAPQQPQSPGNGQPAAPPADQTGDGLSAANEPLDSPEPDGEAAPSVARDPLYEPQPEAEHEEVRETESAAQPESVAQPEPTAQPEPAARPEPVAQSGPTVHPEVTAMSDAARPEPTPAPEAMAAEGTAREEVTRAWRPMTELNTESGDGRNGDNGHNGKGGHSEPMDLTTIASLADWVADVVERLGSERAEAILDISEMVGFVDTDLKEVLAKFIHPSPGEKEGKVTTRDYLVSLKELDRILGKATKFEIALLTILCQGNDSG